MKTVEELQLELLEEQEKNKSLQSIIDKNNGDIASLQKTNTKLYGMVTSEYDKPTEPVEKEETVESWDNFIGKQLGGK